MSETGSWVWDVHQAEPVYWSEQMCRLHGLDPNLGPPSTKEFRELYSPLDCLRWLAAVQECVGRQEEFQFDCEVRQREGSAKRIRLKGRPIEGRGGKVTEILGWASEATIPLVVYRSPQRSSNGRYGRPFGIVHSPRWPGHTDRTAELFYSWWLDLVHPMDRDAVKQRWEEATQTGTRYQDAYRIRWADNSYRWVETTGEAIDDGDGHILNWCVLLVDIDDRKRAEADLLEKELKFQIIFESIPALFCSMSASGELEYANSQLLQYTGRTLAELRGWTLMGTVHHEDLETVLTQWQHSIVTGQRYELEHRIQRADGVYRWFRVHGIPLLDTESRIVRWHVLLTDVDDRRRLAKELLDTQSKLTSASHAATVSELSASIAHEVNQPLAAIMANGQACQTWLSHNPPNLHGATSALERMIQNAEAAAEIVERIRSLFKRTTPAKVPSAINETICEVIRLTESEISDRSIELELNLAPDLPPVAHDRIQIQQCLLNLVRNAIEAMGGEKNGKGVLSLNSTRDGAYVRIQVSDNGCGIGNLDAIFDPFFTTKQSGMGMGLTICRSIVDAHYGRLTAIPNKDAGTIFSLTLPFNGEHE